jgi:hypothetical protein
MYSFDYVRRNHRDIINNLAPKKNRTKAEDELFVRALRMEELLYEQEVERELEGDNEI